MTNQNEPSKKLLLEGFQSSLNEHGYSFQYSVLKHVQSLYDSKKSLWRLPLSEFPVAVGEKDTRIDFLLLRQSFYLLAECKRVFGKKWCFVRSSFLRQNMYDPYFLESAFHEFNSPKWEAFGIQQMPKDLTYDAGLELEPVSINKVQGFKGSPDPIEKTMVQISKGSNGFIQFMLKNPHLFGAAQKAVFIPVVFTNAPIWVTGGDLSSANLETGNLILDESSFELKKWIAYRYNISPTLKHTFQRSQLPHSLSSVLDEEYTRTIFIVNWEGIEDFLRWSSNLDLQ